MKLRKAITMKEYRRRRKARGFAGEARRRRLPSRTQQPDKGVPLARGGAAVAAKDRGVAPPQSGAAAAAKDNAPKWAKPLALSPFLQVRARQGTRAVVMPLRPGLFLVGEVPDGAVAKGAQKLAGAMVKLAQGALGRDAGGSGKPPSQQGTVVRQLPPPREPAPSQEEATDPQGGGADDIEGLFGCERCCGRCGSDR